MRLFSLQLIWTISIIARFSPQSSSYMDQTWYLPSYYVYSQFQTRRRSLSIGSTCDWSDVSIFFVSRIHSISVHEREQLFCILSTFFQGDISSFCLYLRTDCIVHKESCWRRCRGHIRSLLDRSENEILFMPTRRKFFAPLASSHLPLLRSIHRLVEDSWFHSALVGCVRVDIGCGCGGPLNWLQL